MENQNLGTGLKSLSEKQAPVDGVMYKVDAQCSHIIPTGPHNTYIHPWECLKLIQEARESRGSRHDFD